MLGPIDIVAVVIDICVACSSRLSYHLHVIVVVS